MNTIRCYLVGLGLLALFTTHDRPDFTPLPTGCGSDWQCEHAAPRFLDGPGAEEPAPVLDTVRNPFAG